MKSLLQLLSEEDKACREYSARKKGFDNLAKNNASETMILGFQGIVDSEKKRLDDIREELQEYISMILSQSQWWGTSNPMPSKIEPFMRMLMKEARRDSLVDLCKKWDMSEIDMHECINYLSDTLGVSLY